MKRKLALFILAISFTFAACKGKPEVTDPNEKQNTETSVSVSDETQASVSDESEPVPTVEDTEPTFVQEEMAYYYYSDDHSVCIKLDYDVPEGEDAVTIIDGDLVIPVDIAMGSYGTEIEKIDVDSDGESEYVICECEGTGTGCSMYGLVIVKKNGDDYTLTRYDSEYFAKIIRNRVEYEYHEDVNYLSIYVDEDSNSDSTIFLPDPETTDGTLRDLCFGDIIRVELIDRNVWISAPVGYLYGETIIPDYSPVYMISAPVKILADLSLEVGNFRGYNSETSNYDITDEIGKEDEIYHCYYDVTHDGVDDMIVTSLVVPSDFEGEISDADFNGTFGYIKVLEGYTDSDSNEVHFSEIPVYVKDYGVAHTGNVQAFATTVKGKSYLVVSSFYSGQGLSSYRYEVFFLGYSSGPVLYSVESMNMDFEMTDETVDTSEFINGLYKWINESSILLVATDIDLDPALYYSSRKGVLNPDVYYSQRK